MKRILLLFFPAGWRARYGEELLELVSDTGLTARGAADICRAGLAERVRAARAALTGGTSMIFGPAWRHPTAWAVVGAFLLLPIVFFLTVSILAQLGMGGLSGFSDPLNTWLNSERIADLLLVLSPAVAALLAGVPIVRIGFTRIDGSSEASLSVRVRAANVLVVVVALVIAAFLVGQIIFESVMQVGP